MARGTNNTRTDRLAEAHERLLEAVQALATGEDWRAMLDVARRFHTYSANNVWMILSQRPAATRVAGYRRWQSLGRHVLAGEHGIAILAPVSYKPGKTAPTEQAEAPAPIATTGSTPDGERRVILGFRVAHVFDIDQTGGAALPEVVPAVLDGDVPAELWDRLEELLYDSGFRLLRGNTGTANATTSFLTQTVVVGTGLAPAQAAKSLAHEVAHTMLHDGTEYERGCRGVAEVEAESVAYLVCAAAGMATDAYSFPYVARWSDGDVALVRTTAERVVGCARRLVTALGLDAEVGLDEVVANEAEGAP
jgi:hypothetical protein